MDPLISVLLPVYNGQAGVRQAMESVLAQDYANFEFVIVDNASTDLTPAIIGEFEPDSRVRVVRNREVLPRLENFVKTFSLASEESRWLKFIGDDDRLLPGCLNKMTAAGESSENIGLVSAYYFDGDRPVSGFLAGSEVLFGGPELLRRLLLEPESRRMVFSPASLMVSHRAYREMGGFRTDLLHADSELFYRILNRYDLAFVQEILTVSGYHGTSGQAESTKSGHTFSEAYLIRHGNLRLYDSLKLSVVDKERIKLNLVTDSIGFVLARLAAGDFKIALDHLRKIPPGALYHFLPGMFHFFSLAVRKLARGERVKMFKRKG